MPHKELFRHECFTRQLNNLKSEYDQAVDNIDSAVDGLLVNPFSGDRMTGYKGAHLRKLRVALSAYDRGKRAGLRLVWLLIDGTDLLLPVAYYCKKSYKRESQMIRMIKENLKEIEKQVDEMEDEAAD